MAIRRKLEEKIRKKEQEMAELEARIREGRVYIQALQDVLKVMPKESATQYGAQSLRAGSLAARAKHVLEKHGAPMHVNKLMETMGIESGKKSSLAGTLAFYVRKHEIFTRPAPNTFGLIGQKRDDEEPAIGPGFPDPGETEE